MKIDNNEIKRILEMHNKLNPKKVLLEQAADVQTELKRIIDIGCIQGVTYDDIKRMKTTNPQYQFAIKKESKKNPGKFRYFYADYTASEFENGKPKKLPGKWSCDETKMKGDLENFKKTGQGGGWMEYDEAVKSNTIDFNNKETYDTTTFAGKYLYRAKQRAGQKPLTQDQLAYVKPYTDKGWILPSDPKLTGPDKDNYEEVIVPGSKQAFGGEGIKMYQPLEDIKLRSADVLNKAAESIAARSYERKDCKDFLDTYWKSWIINRGNPKARPDERLKIATQACIRQHYKKWGRLAGGKWDDIIEALVGMGDGSHDGSPGPLQKSEWRLLPADYQ